MGRQRGVLPGHADGRVVPVHHRGRGLQEGRSARPGLCGHPPPQPSGPFRRGCGFDLSETDTVRLEPDSPVLRAQTRIMEIFESRERPLAFGAYRHSPQPAPAVLLDIRALGSRFLTDLPREELVARLPAGLADAYLSCDDREAPWENTNAGKAASAPTVTSSAPNRMHFWPHNATVYRNTDARCR